MRARSTILAISSLLLLACSSNDELLSDEASDEAMREIVHAPHVVPAQSESQAILGAVLVLQFVPKAEAQVRNDRFIGTDWRQVPLVGENSAALRLNLQTIRHGLCQIRAAEDQVRDFEVCGWSSSSLPDTAKLLASGAAPIGQDMSRDRLLEGLDQAAQYAKGALRSNCRPLLRALQADTQSPAEDREVSLREYGAYCSQA